MIRKQLLLYVSQVLFPTRKMPFARLEPKLDQCMSNSTLNSKTDTMAWEFQTGFPVNASPSEIDKNDSHKMSQQVHIIKTDHKNSGQDTITTGT